MSSFFPFCCHSGSANLESSCLDILLGIFPLSNGPPPIPLQILNLGAAIVIAAGNIFWLRSDQATADDFRASLERYQRLGITSRVQVAVWDRFKDETGHYDTPECIHALLQIILDNQMHPEQ